MEQLQYAYPMLEQNLSMPEPTCCWFFRENDYRVAPVPFCLEGEDYKRWEGDGLYWDKRLDSLKCGKNVTFQYGNNAGFSSGAGPTLIRNLEGSVEWVSLRHYDADALVGGVTLFKGNQCGSTSMYRPGPSEGSE